MTELDSLAELHDSRHETPKYVEVGYPMVRVTDIRRGYLNTKNSVCVDEETYLKFSNKHRPVVGDILFSRVGSYGNSSFVIRNKDVCLGQNTVCISPKRDRIDPFFLYCCLNSDLITHQVSALVGGASQGTISLKSIKTLRIPCPSIPIQRRIAGILSAYDDLIENNQRRIKILEEMARSLYREWFVNFRFPGHEKVPRLDSPLGDIPQGWEVKSIQQFGTVITGKTPSKANGDFYGNDVPFVKTPDMHGNMFILGTNDCLSTAGAESQANKTLPARSICVSCIGTIGVVSITTEDCQTNQQINSVVVANPASREFLFLRLQDAKQRLENIGANGATMGNVNKGKFEAMEIVCPPDNLLTRYHRLVEPIFSEILSLLRQIQNLRRTRDLLLPRLLSGQVDLATADTKENVSPGQVVQGNLNSL